MAVLEGVCVGVAVVVPVLVLLREATECTLGRDKSSRRMRDEGMLPCCGNNNAAVTA